MTEKLCLKWNDFKEITNTAFGSLRNNTEFSDVTLACEDGQQIELTKLSWQHQVHFSTTCSEETNIQTP